MSINISLVKPPTCGIISENIDDILDGETYSQHKIYRRVKRVPERTAHLPIGLMMVAQSLQEAISNINFKFVDLALFGKSKEIKTIQYGGEQLTITKIGRDFDEISDIVSECDFHLVTAQVVTERRNVVEVTKTLKKISKGKIVVGGHDASINPIFYANEESIDLVYRGTDPTILAKIIKDDLSLSTKIVSGGTKYLIRYGIFPRFDLIPHLNAYNISPEGSLPTSAQQIAVPVYFTLGCAEGNNCCGHNRLGGNLDYDLESMIRYSNFINKTSKTFLIMDEQPAGLMLTQKDGADIIKKLFTHLRSKLATAYEFVNTIATYRILKYIQQTGDREIIPIMFGNEISDNGTLVGCFGACCHFGLMRQESLDKTIDFIGLIFPHIKTDFRLSINTLSLPSTSISELKTNFDMLKLLDRYIQTKVITYDTKIKVFFNHYFRTEESDNSIMPIVVQNPEIKCYTFMPWHHPQFNDIHRLVTSRLFELNKGVVIDDRGIYNYH